MRAKLKTFAVAAILCALCGCAPRNARDGEIQPSVLIEVPQTRQATPYTCGVAALQSILAHNGFDYRQDVLELEAEATPERGARPEAMMAAMRSRGIAADIVQNMTLPQLRASIDTGRPVICFLQAWNDDPGFDYSTGWEDGHYAIAIGYDAERVYFMDPSTLANYTYIPNAQFLARWHDGDERHQVYQTGIVVTNPNPVYRRNAFLPML